MSALKWESLAEFYARAESMPEPAWLIDDLVPASGRVALVAAPNAGKTWAALVIALTAGRQGRDVLLVLEEGGVRQTANRFQSLGFDSERVRLVHLGGVRLEDKEMRRALAEAVKHAREPVLVIDPLSSVFCGDENSTEEMNEFKAQLEEVVRSNPSVLLVLLHHTSKGSERDGNGSVYSGRGSSVMAGWVDVQLNLVGQPAGPNSGVVTVDLSVAKMRDGARGVKKRMTISLGSAEPVCITDADSGGAQDMRAEIRDVVGRAPKPLSKNAIGEAVGGRRNKVLKLIDYLQSEGVLMKVADGYRLAEVVPVPVMELEAGTT